MGDKFLRT